MTRYPGEYELMYVLSEDSKSSYYALTDADRMTIKNEVEQKIKNTIYVDRLEPWDFAHNKIDIPYGSYLAESEIRHRLEVLVGNLPKPGYQLSVMPQGNELPAVLGYNKEFDCGRSCHHSYDLYLSDGIPPDPERWIIRSDSFPLIWFHLRVTFMYIAPPQYHAVMEYELKPKKAAVLKHLDKKNAAKGNGAIGVPRRRKPAVRRAGKARAARS